LETSIVNGIVVSAREVKIIERMRLDRSSIRFADLVKVCVLVFGEPRQRGTSHMVFRTPWPGDPRVNVQNDRGMAKPYQVKQVLAAIDRMKGEMG
jgi:hypothetical protein